MTLCPLCGEDMGQDQENGAVLRRCAKCPAAWIGTAELERVLATVERRFRPAELVRLKGECAARRKQLTSGEEAGARGKMYPPCPECGEAMNRRAFAEVSGILTSVCVRHGSLFLDDGFRQAVEFVAGGGEMVAGEARIEQLSRQIAGLSSETREAREKIHRLEGSSDTPIFFLG